jgi:hypothetical protein
MARIKITLSDVFKKDLRIVAFLGGSWIVALVLAYILADERLVGLAPILNYITYRLEQELKGEGYARAIK